MTQDPEQQRHSGPREQEPSAAPAMHRQETRQPVDTRSVLHLVSSGSRFPGRILDLSLHGCCLQTDQPFPLGIYRRVETEFQLEGLPVRLAGVTQAIYNRCTVGVRFLDVSPRKLEQLQQLMDEIEVECRNRQNSSGQDSNS